MPFLPQPLSAPFSITVHLHKFLHEHVSTKLYDWEENGSIKLNEADVILGHPHPNPNTIVQKTILDNRKCRAKALIFPIHHAIASINEFTLPLIERSDIVFAIMGRYWHETLDGSMFAPWKNKITRLDMAIDTRQYPKLKEHFNLPGRRGYLFIGNNRPEKGCEILGETMGRLRNYPKGWIGEGPEIPNIQRIARYSTLTPEFMSLIVEKFDFFVNTSVSDANPATILEAMAWGFPVACTPQSGYHNIPSIVQLSTQDITANADTLSELQYAPEEYLLELSDGNRDMVEKHYTWGRFCQTVWRGLKPFIQE